MKATLITGASGGIGEAFARRLAVENHNLVLVARSENKLHDLCDELMVKHKITAHYIAVDLIDFEADLRLFEETEKHKLEIDWLINNAGFGSMGDFANLELENELEMINLNVLALVALTHRYLQKMRERQSGTIINVASTASFQPVPFMATYAATKAFVKSFSEAIAEENRLFNITVTALCPGPTETNFFDAANIGTNVKDAFLKKGMQTPEAVVEAALSAVKRGKSSVVSGWTNYMTARLGNFVPNSLITRAVGGVLRPKFEEKKQIGNAGGERKDKG
ncbi:MAG: SDR family oxidoreductase [Acidobacteria bacterium]|nr:SDR family oxidoreductase [Acidobacteriota bacterium]MBA4121834.1 SDR family oxidoreductase [Acidobacteriota bacterium]MBA4183474.1 SDR family oxidoreductase [Acidobacteriota bacterium]HEV8159920.1 SDR family oxidoreductase [Pyrinomonadaceae bacterium]